jgi:HAD superfamily hydrolase (TIGR01509 family)
VAIEAVIFDFDGLLMDTEGSALAAWQYEYRVHGLELDLTTFWADHGGDVTEQRYSLLAELVGPAFDRAVSDARRREYRDRLHESMQLCPGIPSWLDEAATLGLRLAVASSSPTEWVRKLLDGVNSLDVFELTACGEEVAAPKPDPAVYLLALQRLGLDGRHAIAVEDSPHGVAAAHAAGMQCIAIPNGHTDPARFGAADVLLTNATDASLAATIESLQNSASVPDGDHP